MSEFITKMINEIQISISQWTRQIGPKSFYIQFIYQIQIDTRIKTEHRHVNKT
jgi:hypothetical protein